MSTASVRHPSWICVFANPVLQVDYNTHFNSMGYNYHTGTVSQATVKQSSRYVTYAPIWIHWQHISCSAGHMGHDVACTSMA